MLDEEKLRGKAIGTTGRGIGPTYEDKVARRGVRVADLLHADSLREKLEGLIELKNFELEKLYGWPKIDVGKLFETAAEFGRQLEPYVDHTGHILDEALRSGKNVLFEGAQGTFLDLDHGTVSGFFKRCPSHRNPPSNLRSCVLSTLN